MASTTTITSNDGNNNNQYVITLKRMLAGAGSGMITKSSTAPLERIKILFQVQSMMVDQNAKSTKYGRNIFGAMRVVFAEEGIRGFWKGNGANVFRVVPVYALKFTFNDTFRDMVAKPGQDKHSLSFKQMMAAGTLAGLFQSTATYPLETIRTRLSLAAAFGNKYKGIVDCARVTMREEGAFALYKGIVPTFFSGGPYVGLQMTFYEMFRRWYPHDPVTGERTLFWSLAGGASAGIVAQTITFPGDTLRRRMQTNGIGGSPVKYANTLDCIRKILTREGIPGMFRGVVVNNMRALPGAAIQFATYDFLKSLFKLEQ